ncbi:MAG TPA: hypothetical protein VF669_22995 [Tepidisphaeraceae bacterium]|jgi:hypothetical protein
MNRRPIDMPYRDEVMVEQIKPNRLAIVACQVWQVFCGVMFALCVTLEIRRAAFVARPVPVSEIVAWVCFDALFLLGAYAGLEFLCGNDCTTTNDND